MARHIITVESLTKELGPGADVEAVFDAVCLAGGYGDVGNMHHSGTVLDFASLDDAHKTAVEKVIADAKPAEKKADAKGDK